MPWHQDRQGDAVSRLRGDQGDAVSRFRGDQGDAVSRFRGDQGDAVSRFRGDQGGGNGAFGRGGGRSSFVGRGAFGRGGRYPPQAPPACLEKKMPWRQDRQGDAGGRYREDQGVDCGALVV
jgi:hypothetical protein